jgi:hypothetical protein
MELGFSDLIVMFWAFFFVTINIVTFWVLYSF